MESKRLETLRLSYRSQQAKHWLRPQFLVPAFPRQAEFPPVANKTAHSSPSGDRATLVACSHSRSVSDVRRLQLAQASLKETALAFVAYERKGAPVADRGILGHPQPAQKIRAGICNHVVTAYFSTRPN